jgi:two-component system sensor histidine kinase UhpB
MTRLAALMGAVEPGQPGRRAILSSRAGAEVTALGEALNSMLDRLEDERRESGRRALAAQEGERARIARELHDEVGQTLTAVALRAERAMGEMSPQDEALAEIAETVLRSLEDVHRMGRELRPEALDELGLVSALIALCSRVTEQGGLNVCRELEWQLPALPGEVELVIYRVAQEALTNALRHAHAEHATVRLRCVDERVALSVRDDGRGFPERAGERGIAGMRERALLIGADLEVRRRPRDGDHPQSPDRARGAMVTPLKTRVLLADDHAIVRSGLRAVLDGQADIEVVAEAADGIEAIERAVASDVDLAILDISMPGLTGLQVTAELRRRRPAVRVLILSVRDSEQYFFEALKAGASG